MGAPYDDLMLADPSQPQGPTDGSGLTPDQRAALAAAVIGAPAPSISATLQSLLTPPYLDPPPAGLSPEDHANITALLGGPRPAQSLSDVLQSLPGPILPPGAAGPAPLDPTNGLTNGIGLLPQHQAALDALLGRWPSFGQAPNSPFQPLADGDQASALAATSAGVDASATVGPGRMSAAGQGDPMASPHAANVLQYLAGQANNPFIRFDPASGRLQQWTPGPTNRASLGASGAFQPMSDADTQGFIERQLNTDSYPQGQKSPQESALEAQLDPGNPLSPQALREFYALKQMLADPSEEKDVPYVYLDSTKHLTAGIGHKVLPSDHLKLGDPVSDAQINQFFSIDGSAALAAAHKQAAEAGISDPAFILPLASVNFQAGPGWRHNEPPTWQYIMAGRYADAAASLDGTIWQKESPRRVQDFQTALRMLSPRAQN